jgi:hypothetical protein
MRCIRIATFLGALTLSAASLSAQGTASTPLGPPAATGNATSAPARSEVRAVRQSLRQDVVARKTAKANGDAAGVKAAGKNLRADRKRAAALGMKRPHAKRSRRKPLRKQQSR